MLCRCAVDYLRSNPAVGVKPPRPTSGGPTALRYWTALGLRSFLSYNSDHHHASLWTVSASTGMRRGELLGLHGETLISACSDSLCVRHHLGWVRSPSFRRCRSKDHLGHATVAFTMEVYAHVIPECRLRRRRPLARSCSALRI